MAYSIGTFSALISLLFLFISVAPSTADKHTKLRTICSKTFDRHLCKKLMKSDSRTRSGISNCNLTIVAIDLAYSKAKDVRRDFESLSDGDDGRSGLKFRYRSCSRNYRDAERDLGLSKSLFYDRKYKRVAIKASDAARRIRDCTNQIQNRDGDTAKLKKNNRELVLLCDVVNVVASGCLRDKSS